MLLQKLIVKLSHVLLLRKDLLAVAILSEVQRNRHQPFGHLRVLPNLPQHQQYARLQVVKDETAIGGLLPPQVLEVVGGFDQLVAQTERGFFLKCDLE